MFNLNSGEKLGLDDIFKIRQKEYLKIIMDKVSQKIQEDKKTDEGNKYNFGNPYSAEGKAVISKYDIHNFYLTKNALVVFYPKYALAYGAARSQKFEILFASISDVLAIDVNTVPMTNGNVGKDAIKTGMDIYVFIPEGWKVLEKVKGKPEIAEGDLNKDGISDIAAVIMGVGKSEESSPRALLIAFGNKDKTYTLSIIAEKAILRAEQGGVWGDPFESISINSGLYIYENR